MTSNQQPTNYKMKMEYKDMRIEVAGDRGFVEEKFYQLVTAVNKLARHGFTAEADMNGTSVDTSEIFPRPVNDMGPMLDAGLTGDAPGEEEEKGDPVKVERMPRDTDNEWLEYLYEVTPGSQVDTVLAMTMYLDEEKEMEEISVRDIHDFYKRSHTAVPKNLSVSLQQNVNKGYLERSGNRKDGVRYNVTDGGARYVKNNFTQDD